MVYVINGLLCGIAAVVLTARLDSVQSTGGEGIEMDAIAAVILGGTSLSGGVRLVLPTVVGAMNMGVIDNILTLMNVNPHATRQVFLFSQWTVNQMEEKLFLTMDMMLSNQCLYFQWKISIFKFI